MKNFFFLFFFFFFLILVQKKKKKFLLIKEKDQDLEMIEAYKEGLKALEKEMFFLLQKILRSRTYYFHNQMGTKISFNGSIFLLSQDYYSEAIFEFRKIFKNLSKR
jgi:hypothetical protein